MQKYGFIYITTNTINGKKYIGQTSFKRGEAKNNNYLGSGKYLKEAIKKYGTKCFTKEIIFVAHSFEDLNWAERHFIEQYDAVKSREFYNVSPGGRASLGFTGKKHSQERNQKLSDKLKGHTVSDKVRTAVSETGKKSVKKLNSTFIECPHCKRVGTLGPMSYWHMDNCKVIKTQPPTQESRRGPQNILPT